MNHLELIAEGVIKDFLPLHVEYQLHRLNKFWAALPDTLSAYAVVHTPRTLSLAHVLTS